MKICKIHTNVKAPDLCPTCLYEECERHKQVTRAILALRKLEAEAKGEEWWAPEETPPECIEWAAKMDAAEAELDAALLVVEETPIPLKQALYHLGHSNTFLDELRDWLKDASLLEYFRGIYREYGSLNVCFSTEEACRRWGIKPTAGLRYDTPHPVHFREGMAVRNKMRELTDYKYDAAWYDENWALAVIEILEREIKHDT